MLKYDLIIVGAGASGLVAAIAGARNKQKVLVIEKNSQAGKKILATGNGRCNYTNLYQDAQCYRSDDSEFVRNVLSHFDVQKTISFFKELGVYPNNVNGYIYPNSEQASSLVDLLMIECKRLKVDFRFQEKVIEVQAPHFTIKTQHTPMSEKKLQRHLRKKGDFNSYDLYKDYYLEDRQEFNSYHGKKLILATGGRAQPKLGSDGSGYTIAKLFGHSLNQPLPALVQLESPDKICQTVAGVRCKARVKVICEKKLIAYEEGEINFTDYGISGIPIMQISRFVSIALAEEKDIHLDMDLLTDLSDEDLKDELRKRISHNGHKNIHQILIGLLNDKLSYGLVKRAGIDLKLPSKEISHKELERLVDEIKEFILIIDGTKSFDRAQVTTGGIPTKEVNPDNMESKLVDNLYLAGELLDVDGTCGGYNLQWAWSSGYLAGNNSI